MKQQIYSGISSQESRKPARAPTFKLFMKITDFSPLNVPGADHKSSLRHREKPWARKLKFDDFVESNVLRTDQRPTYLPSTQPLYQTQTSSLCVRQKDPIPCPKPDRTSTKQ